MKILFLGGTKFFGKLIVDELHTLGHELTIISRGSIFPVAAFSRHIQGDRNDQKVLSQVSFYWDVVIDNIAYGPEDVQTLFKYIQTDHYIVTSSIGSYYPYVSEYSRKKLELEKYIWESDIPWTIMRPGIVYGPNDPTGKLVTHYKASFHFTDKKISFVFSEDLPKAYISVIDESRYFQAFDLCHPKALTSYELSQMHDSSGMGEDCPYVFRHDFIGHPEYAMQMLDWKPTPWEVVVRKTLPWIKEQIK